VISLSLVMEETIHSFIIQRKPKHNCTTLPRLFKKTKMPTKQFTQTFSNKSENIYAKTFYKIFASFGG